MKTLTVSTLALMLSANIAAAEGELFLYNWTDYTAPDLIEKFEAETGISVTLDTYDSNETLLAKLQSGATGYDIVVPSHNFVQIFVSEGLLQEISASELTGYENISADFASPSWDEGNVYTIPWQWGTTSFTVNTDVFGGDINTYDILFQPPAELEGKIGMFRSADEVISMAQLSLGLGLCSEDPNEMQQVLDLLLAQKDDVKTYSSDGILERLASGDVAVHQNWNGYSIRAREENPAMQYAFPKEGVITWADNIAVPVGAPNYDNAIKFVEFLMQPENIAIQSNFAGYSNGITGSADLMNDDLKAAGELSPPEGTPLVFSQTCSPAAVELQNRVWTALLQ
ncbi:spermidine/putrescine ABC transporter substrate-binding protein [Loktanella sp. D2R18]|uniref:ABC transporter substrate-binding protein n=1 Tax=Rhodobacterales TaxID=204455 RepID=UPI000DEBFD22|nr:MULTISPECIES: extracellular solute-binding protein [Rhodobacterales]MDO6589753.1 extracellular solute-binding protein [Yoonia sp. 1_MG-2023]RBW44377.1 spermidine/putrescine ABC transporter substrate-binding protein [Loktanella sp. D2R18]